MENKMDKMDKQEYKIDNGVWRRLKIVDFNSKFKKKEGEKI